MASRGSGRDEYPYYVFTGFSALLDWRPVQFIGTRQLRNVCDSCSVIASSVRVTRCSHFFCFFCWETIAGCKTNCPVCDREVAHDQALVLYLDESHMDDYEVRCFNAARGCPFEGALWVMKNHFMEHCRYGQAKCPRCHQPVSRMGAVEHRAACKFGLLPAAVEAQQLLSHVGTPCTTPQHADRAAYGWRNTPAWSPEEAVASGEMAGFARAEAVERQSQEEPVSAVDFATSAKRGPELVESKRSAGARSLAAGAAEEYASAYSRSYAYRRDTNWSAPESLPATSVEEAGPSTEMKTALFRSKSAGFNTRKAPRFAPIGVLRLSGRIVTNVARSKPWAGPSGVIFHLPTHVRDLSSSPPEEKHGVTEQGKLSLADLLAEFKKDESSLSQGVLRRLLLSSAAANCLDSAQSGSLVRKDRRVAPPAQALATSAATNVSEAAEPALQFTETATGASKPNLGSEAVLSENWMFCSPTTDVPAYAVDLGAFGHAGDQARRRHASTPETSSQHTTVPPITITERSISVQVPPDYGCASAYEISAADVGEGGPAEASEDGRDVTVTQGSSKFVIPRIVITDCSTPVEAPSRVQGNVDLVAHRRTSLKVPATDALGALYSERIVQSEPPRAVSSLMSSTDGALCCFADVLHVRRLLEDRGTLLIRSDEATVYGYTFQLSCLFRRAGNAVSVAFEFCIVSGDGDAFCEWPFDCKLALQLVHPEDSSRNFSWALLLSRAAAAVIFRKPSRNTCNPGCLTEFLCWEDIEAAGFIGDGFLRVYVAFQ